MKNFILLLIIPFLTYCGQQENKNPENPTPNKSSVTSSPSFKATYYLIRHAEKDRTNPKNENPNLNDDGLRRAKNWAKYFESIPIDDIYITKYLRTKQTVSFIAKQKAITPIIYEPNNIYSENFLQETNNKSILIAGHSNTTPMLVNKLLSEEKFGDMDDRDNATLFKVSIDGNNRKAKIFKVD